jgi:hypothetical protein
MKMRQRKYSYMGHPLKDVSLGGGDTPYPKYIMNPLIELRDLVLARYPAAEIKVQEGLVYELDGFHMFVTVDANPDEFYFSEDRYKERLLEMNLEEDLPIHLHIESCGESLRRYNEEIRREREEASSRK